MRLKVNSVVAIAKGNREKLVSSGFDLVKTRQSRPMLVKPLPPRISGTDNSGQIKSIGKRHPGLLFIIHQITEYPLTSVSLWNAQTTSSVKHVFTDFIPNRNYLIRLCAIGVNKQCIESEPVNYIAQ